MAHQVIRLNANVASIGQRAVELTERGRITRSERNTLWSKATFVMGEVAILMHQFEQRCQAVPVLTCATDLMMAGVPGL
ncbi:Phage regulatory protein CII (CP76) [compost metagenome]